MFRAFGPAAVTVGAYEPNIGPLVTYPWALGSGSRLTGDLGFTAISMRTPPDKSPNVLENKGTKS